MKHELIDSSSRVWVVTLGPDGRLTEELDAQRLSGLDPAQAAEISDSLLRAAEMDVARTRLW